MSKNKTDIGHYVPRTYLRSFAYKGDTCYVYDKTQPKYYQANVDNIMGERYFYDIPEEIVKLFKQNGFKQDIDIQLLEKMLGSTVDSYWGNIVKNIDQNYDEWFSLNRSWQFLDAYRCIAIQILRTPNGKATIIKAYRDIYNKNIDDKAMNVLVAGEIGEVLKATPDSFLLNFLLNDFGHICVGVNETDIPFITGDNPVLYLGKYGEDKEDIIYYPITPTRCIFLRKRKQVEAQLQTVLQEFLSGTFRIKEDLSEINTEEYRREKALRLKRNPTSEVIDADKVFKLNSSIYLASTRFVVSNKNLQEKHEKLYFMLDDGYANIQNMMEEESC